MVRDEFHLEFADDGFNGLGLHLEFGAIPKIVAPPPEPDPPPAVRWVNPPANEVAVLEGQLARLFFDLSVPHTADIEVTLGLFAETPGVGILEPGIDFAWDPANPPTWTIPAGQTQGAFLIQVLQETATEPEETHRFVFASAVEIEPQPGFEPGSEQSCPIITPLDTSLRVFESDPATQEVQLSTSNVLVYEDSAWAFEIVLSQEHTSPVSVTLSQISGGDLSDRLIVSPTTVTFSPGDRRKIVRTIGVENGVNEGPEIGEWQITGVDAPYVIGSLDTVAVEIRDPAPTGEPIFKWSTDVAVMGEPGNQTGVPHQMALTVVIDNPSEVDLTVARTVRAYQISGDAIDPDDYFWPQGKDFNFGAGAVSVDKLVEIAVDSEPEEIETALLGLQVVSGGGVPSTLDGELELQIHSNESSGNGSDLQIQFLYPSEVRDSGDGTTIQMWVTMSRAFEEDVHLPMVHYSPNAVHGVDYERTGFTSMQNLVTIPAGVTEVLVEFELLAPATATSLKWLVSELQGTTHGQLWMCTRHLTVMKGDTDERGCVPEEPPLPNPYDFRLYRDRVEPASLRAIKMFPGGVTWPVTGPLGGYANSPFKVVAPYLYQLWRQQNPTGSRWMDSGNAIVVAIMEDIPSRMFINSHSGGIEFIDGANQLPVRDVWFEGVDQGGGVKPVIGSVVIWSTEGSAVLPIDNLHFRGLEIRDFYEGSEKHSIKNIGPTVAWPALHHGIMRVHFCLIRDATESAGAGNVPGMGSGSQGHGKSGIRCPRHSNYWITACEFGIAFEHSFYVSQIVGLCIFANNTMPRGTGRTMLQAVQRPLEVNGVMGHGLLAIVGNLDNDMGDPQGCDTGAKAFSIYGFWGDVLMYDNTHTGRLQRAPGDPYEKQNNRGGPATLTQYVDHNGFYVAEWPPFSGEFYSVKRLRIENDLFSSSSATDLFKSRRMEFRGVYDLEIGGFTTDVVPPSLNASVDMITFNHRVEINRGFPLLDQVGRDASSRAGQYMPNRAGGVVWLGAASTPLAGPIDGALLAYAGASDSNPKYKAGVAEFNYDQDFERDFDTGGAQPDVNSYDGSDPA